MKVYSDSDTRGALDERLIAEVYAPGTGRYGTGIVIAPSLVLTAHHTVRGIQADGPVARLRCDAALQGAYWVDVETVWCRPDLDAALIAPAGNTPILSPGTFTLVRFGRRPRNDIPCRV